MFYNKWRNLASSAMWQERLVPCLAIWPWRACVEESRFHLSARARRARKAFHLAPPFGQKEARNSASELGLHSWYGLNAGPDQRAANKTLHSDILAGAFRNAYSPTIGTACLPRCSCLQRFLTRSRSISFSPSQNKNEPEVMGLAPSFWCV